MEYTGLVVGGFTQPSVARGLIESIVNIEKGVCQRFLWVLPKPCPTKFCDLKEMNEEFSDKIGS